MSPSEVHTALTIGMVLTAVQIIAVIGLVWYLDRKKHKRGKFDGK
jgi:hypothetical protein